MRPCSICGLAMENRAVACPRCGTAAAGPKATPAATREEPGFFAAWAEVLATGGELFLPLGLLIAFVMWLPFLLLLSVPLVVGGGIGYLIGDAAGLVIGVIAAAVLVVAVKAWREERAGRPAP